MVATVDLSAGTDAADDLVCDVLGCAATAGPASIKRHYDKPIGWSRLRIR